MSAFLPYTIIYFVAFIIPIFCYLFVLKNNPNIPEYVLIPIVEGIIMLIFGILTSIMSSMEKCQSYRGFTSFLNGLKLVFAVLITYTIIFLFPSLQFPFIKITGPLANYPIMPYIAQGILLGLSSIPAVTSIWLSSQKYGCYMSQTQIQETKQQMNIDLQQNPESPT